MASKQIIAHENEFNSNSKDNAFYFSNSDEVHNLILRKKKDNLQLIQNNFDAIKADYN
jgi:hypothetical protein